MAKVLSIEKPVDGNFKVVKDSDGTSTALELSADKVKAKNLEVDGETTGLLLPTNEPILFQHTNAQTSYIRGIDYDLEVRGDRDLEIISGRAINIDTFTNDGAGITIKANGNIFLDADGDGKIVMDSDDGYVMRHEGTEFSVSDSAYAGMILGYTVIGLDATPALYDVTAAMLPVHDDLKVSFVFPPSGKVEIFASIYIQTDTSRAVTFGLSTTDASTGFASLGAEYENHTFFADETDGTQHSHRWLVTGTAGDSEDLWFAAGTTQTGRIDLYWGGDSSAVADSSHPIEYQPFVMKAIALPATIYEG